MTLSLTSATGLRLVATLSVAYALSHFLRASLGVIAPELQAELALSPQELGFLSGLFFFAFAGIQIPVGIALDRTGPRRVLLFLSIFTIIGSLIFAVADGVWGLAAGRALMGIGCAAMLMGPYVIYAHAFPPSRFAQVTSIQLGVGNLGVILATAPLAWLALAFGWRSVFVGAAVAAALFALATARVRKEIATPIRRHGLVDDLRGVAEVVRLPGMLRILPLISVAYASLASITALWGGPYLADIHGLGPSPRGQVLFGMAVTSIAGLFAFGPLDRRFNTRKGVVIGGGVISIFGFSGLALFPAGSLALTVTFLLAISFAHGYTVALTAHNRSILPPHLIGRGVTLSNMANMLGAAVLQILLGIVAGAGGGDSALNAETYRKLFALLAGIVLAALVLYATVADHPPEDPKTR